MKRNLLQPRSDWQAAVEAAGFVVGNDGTHWEEGAHYEFTRAQVQEIERATVEVMSRCMDAVRYVVDHPELIADTYRIDNWLAPMVVDSFKRGDRNPILRLDFCYDGKQPPVLLDVEANCTTAILEAGVLQADWMNDVFQGRKVQQFNTLHEKLVATWRTELKYGTGDIVFASFPPEDAPEDFMTTAYLRTVAEEAGWEAQHIPLVDIGWHDQRRVFTDLEERQIDAMFMQYHWGQMSKDAFGQNIPLAANKPRWFPPAWSFILDNKAILVLLSQMNEGHAHILPATFNKAEAGDSYCEKPQFGSACEGITLVDRGREIGQTPEGPNSDLFIYQGLATLPGFEKNYPVIQSWVIDGQPAGIGIREGDSYITGASSRFVPHIIGESRGFFGR